MNKKEVWKEVVGSGGDYIVSSYGRIKSLKSGSERLLKLVPRDNYYVIGVTMNGRRKVYYVHQVVGKTFIPNPDNKPHINHIDGNKQNNRLENLEWANAMENMTHAIKHGLINNTAENHPRAIANWKLVDEIRNKFKPRRYTIPMLCKEYDMNYYTMRNILYNVTWRVQV